jgi:hypothetical protein
MVDFRKVAEEVVWANLNMDMKDIDTILEKPILMREMRLKELRDRLSNL